MGYTLTIGELEVNYDQDEESPHVSLDAEVFSRENAPAFGEPTDHKNTRWPSYNAWSNFSEFVGISELMGTVKIYGHKRDDALIYYHPGVMPLTEQHRKEVNEALAKFKVKYPDAVPTYGNTSSVFEADPDNPECNGYMCRLIWLHYWVNWALDNCKQPVFANS